MNIAMSQSIDPLTLGPALWLDAADTTSITHISGSVSAWNDKSGNSHHVTQTTATNQPTYISQTEGIDFDGVDDMLMGDNTLGYGADTTLTLFVINSASNRMFLII